MKQIEDYMFGIGKVWVWVSDKEWREAGKPETFEERYGKATEDGQ